MAQTYGGGADQQLARAGIVDADGFDGRLAGAVKIAAFILVGPC